MDTIYVLLVIIILIIVFAIIIYCVNNQKQHKFDLIFKNETSENATLKVKFTESGKSYINTTVLAGTTYKIGNPEEPLDISFTSPQAFEGGLQRDGIIYLGRYTFTIHPNGLYESRLESNSDTCTIDSGKTPVITSITVTNNYTDSVTVSIGPIIFFSGFEQTFTISEVPNNYLHISNTDTTYKNDLCSLTDANNNNCPGTLQYMLQLGSENPEPMVNFKITDSDVEVVIDTNGQIDMTNSKGFTICKSS